MKCPDCAKQMFVNNCQGDLIEEQGKIIATLEGERNAAREALNISLAEVRRSHEAQLKTLMENEELRKALKPFAELADHQHMVQSKAPSLFGICHSAKAVLTANKGG